LVCHNLTSFY